MKFAPLGLAIVLIASAAHAQNPLSGLKALQDDGIGSSALEALNACQSLAPAPFGAFVPPNLVINVTGGTVTTAPITVGALPVTIPGQTRPLAGATTTIPGTAFLPPEPRICQTVTVTGESAGSPPQPPGRSEFLFRINVDFSTYRSNASGGGCSLASGELVFVKRSSGNQEQLTMDHSGLLCDVAGLLSEKTYTATYNITGGTRKYAGVAGTGDLAVSFGVPQTLLHLEGNVLFR